MNTHGKRVIAFIDGSNFYKTIRSRMGPRFSGNLTWFDFINNLVSSYVSGGVLIEVRYYVGALKNEGNKSLYANQMKFFHDLNKQRGVVLIKGIVKHIANDITGKPIYKEKGTDVHLALDLFKLTKDDSYDIAFILSGDSDFVQAVKYVQDTGKEVWLVVTKWWRSSHLRSETDRRILFEVSDIIPFKR